MPNITQYHIQWNNGPTKWLTWKITFISSIDADCVEPMYPFAQYIVSKIYIDQPYLTIYTPLWNTVERSLIINRVLCHVHPMTFYLITLSIYEAPCLPRRDKLFRDTPCLCFDGVINKIHTAWLFIYVHQLPRFWSNMVSKPLQIKVRLRQF